MIQRVLTDQVFDVAAIQSKVFALRVHERFQVVFVVGDAQRQYVGLEIAREEAHVFQKAGVVFVRVHRKIEHVLGSGQYVLITADRVGHDVALLNVEVIQLAVLGRRAAARRFQRVD